MSLEWTAESGQMRAQDPTPIDPTPIRTTARPEMVESTKKPRKTAPKKGGEDAAYVFST